MSRIKFIHSAIHMRQNPKEEQQVYKRNLPGTTHITPLQHPKTKIQQRERERELSTSPFEVKKIFMYMVFTIMEKEAMHFTAYKLAKYLLCMQMSANNGSIMIMHTHSGEVLGENLAKQTRNYRNCCYFSDDLIHHNKDD